MDEYTINLMQKCFAENHASDKKCKDCVYYVAEYKDDFTLRFYGYGEVKIRPACGHANSYGYVGHNPAANCRYFEKEEQQ